MTNEANETPENETPELSAEELQMAVWAQYGDRLRAAGLVVEFKPVSEKEAEDRGDRVDREQNKVRERLAARQRVDSFAERREALRAGSR